MKVKTLGRKVSIKQNFIDMVEKRMAKMDRFFDRDAEGQVTVTVEKDRQTVEVTVKSRGFFYRAERTAADMETAFADAADLIVRQIVRNKEKLGSRVKRTELEAPEFADIVAAEEPVTDFEIVREKRFEVLPMTPEEAILQMTMLGHSFFLFRSEETGELCVVYSRNDGDYGLLYPELA